MPVISKKLYFLIRDKLYLNKLSAVLPGMHKPIVFCYHQIDEKEFENHVIFLKKKYAILDLKSFLQKFETTKRGNFCTITIDDCLEEDVNKVIPICIKHNIPLTLFLPVRFSINNEALPGTYLQKLLQKVDKLKIDGINIEYSKSDKNIFLQKVHHIFKIETMKTSDFETKIAKVLKENKIDSSDLVSEGNKVITIDKVKKIATNPLFTFQSHTYNHETLGLCSNDEIEYEFSVSRNTLQEITQKDVYAICYPYGSKEIVGDKIFDIVNKYYKYGFALTQGVCNGTTNEYFIPRIGIYPGDDNISFIGKMYHYLTLDYFKTKL